MMEAKQAAERLLQADNILVISHASPDGDTLGSASALMRGLLQKGKRVRFACSDPVPDKFGYLFGGIPAQNFVPKLSSKVLPDGSIVSPSMDDMVPFLPRD